MGKNPAAPLDNYMNNPAKRAKKKGPKKEDEGFKVYTALIDNLHEPLNLNITSSMKIINPDQGNDVPADAEYSEVSGNEKTKPPKNKPSSKAEMKGVGKATPKENRKGRVTDS